MRWSKHSTLPCILALLASMLPVSFARAQAIVANGVFCDTLAQIEGFAEAHIGAELSVVDALQTINKAAEKQNACMPVIHAIIDNLRDTKELTIAGNTMTVQQVTIVGVMVMTPSGPIARVIPGTEQFILVEKKGQEV
jgi:hypothetical protein